MSPKQFTDLAAKHGTPLYVYSAARIAGRARELRAALAAIDQNTTLCFAAKALSAIKVLRLIRDAGASVEVNSGGELYRAKLAGFPPDAIVFNGVAKSEAELAEAVFVTAALRAGAAVTHGTHLIEA